MALFPKADFEVLLPGGGLFAGENVTGELVIQAAAPIPRAEHIECAFVTKAWATYGSGKNKSTMIQEPFRRAMRLDVPNHELPAGTHRFPFTLDVPHWLPPAFQAQSCGVSHTIEARLDVDWAIDPTRDLHPVVALRPAVGQRESLAMRSPVGFHESLVFEITLASRVLALGEPLVGVIAMRGGFEASFDRLELAYASVARVAMGRNDTRTCAPASTINIPGDSLRTGASISFVIPAPPGGMPTLRNNFVDHDSYFIAYARLPWSADRSFEVRLDVLPAGSTIHGEAHVAEVGGQRLRLLASAMAQGSGLREAQLPTLVEGVRGFVATRLADAPRAATLGVDVDFTFPDVELGIDLRRKGIFDSHGTWRLPPALDDYRLKSAPTAPSVQAFFDVLLDGIAGADIRLSDHHLGFHLLLANDDTDRMVALALAAGQRAAAIDAAIRRLPFAPALAGARPAWEAAAAEQNALLVPTGPALHGVVLRARVIGGEERLLVAAIRTVKHDAQPPTCRVDVRLEHAQLPPPAHAALDDGASSEALRAVRAVFPSMSVLSNGAGVTLEGAAWPADPRALLPVLETFLWWVLETRGERRADAPYR